MTGRHWRDTMMMFERPVGPVPLVCEIGPDGVASTPHPADFPAQARDTFPTDPRQIELFRAERAYLEICERDTGNTASIDKLREICDRTAELEGITDRIAAGLRRVWFEPCYQSEWEIVTVGVHTRREKRRPPLKRMMIFPEQAKKIRQRTLNETEAWLQDHPWDRMIVLTSGGPTRLSELRERQRAHTRKVSRLASEILRPAGIEMILACVEHGKPERNESGSILDAGEIHRDADGEITFHVHTHAIIHHIEGMALPAQKWQQLLRDVWDFWEDWWSDGDDDGNSGVLRKAREVVKYMTKPREIEKLTDPEKAAYAWSLRRLKSVRPMGSLREQIRSRRDRCMRLDRSPTPDGRMWREVFDWDRFKRTRDKPTAWIETAEDITLAIENRERCTQGLQPINDRSAIIARSKWTAQAVDFAVEAICESKGSEESHRGADMLILASLPPRFMPGSNISEPALVVLCRKGRFDAEALSKHPFWRRAEESTRGEWMAGVAALGFTHAHQLSGSDRPDLVLSSVDPPDG